MANVFPMDPTAQRLEDRLRSGQRPKIEAAVSAALDEGHPDLGALVEKLRVKPIVLGDRFVDEAPWVRRRTAGEGDIDPRRNIRPGKRITETYEVYRLTIVAGRNLVQARGAGRHMLDPEFVTLGRDHIVVRAANDRHRDDQIGWIEGHVEAANSIVEKWNADLPSLVEATVARQTRQNDQATERAAKIERAGFRRVPKTTPERTPVVDPPSAASGSEMLATDPQEGRALPSSVEEAPMAFMTYSWDDSAHTDWVKRLARRLIADGVDVALDQWDVKPGDDVAHFMEQLADPKSRVLVVVSDEYTRKANDPSGGVGYEKRVLTARIMGDLTDNKVIPIIRNNPGGAKPTFLGTTWHINFENDDAFEEKYEDLLRTIHDAPADRKPPLGPNPFKTEPEGGTTAGTTGATPELRAAAATSAENPTAPSWKVGLKVSVGHSWRAYTLRNMGPGEALVPEFVGPGVNWGEGTTGVHYPPASIQAGGTEVFTVRFANGGYPETVELETSGVPPASLPLPGPDDPASEDVHPERSV